MQYYELPKLPKTVQPDDALGLWLALFDANTEEDLERIKETGEPIMEEAIKASRHISTTDEFKELERLRSLALHNEASALAHARDEERKVWQVVVADKEAVIADKDAKHASELADKDAKHAAELTAIKEELERLRVMFEKNNEGEK
jgi:hypothetical protein